jgi:NAD(P)-dependent dehydrogenase (short-subunit alcohol dehydrogenase family)
MKKAALITGASSGIGQATALEFARQGYFVYLMGRDKVRLEETALQCGSGACLLSCDLTDPVAVQKRVHEIYENPLYRLEVLVNNAGIFKTHSMEEGTDDVWNEMYQANLLGPVRLTRLLIPYFKKHQKGSIVNVSSTLGMKPSSNTGAYSALKAAMINWTQSLAQEAGAYGVRVNCICPGIVDTPIHAFHDLEDQQKKHRLAELAKLQPLGRIGTPEDLAKSIYFIASDFSAWTTGGVLTVDGGINLQ